MKSLSLLVLAVVIAFSLGLFIEKGDGSNKMNFISVNAQNFKEEIEQKNAVILDIRTPQEFNQGRIAGAVNIDFYESNFRDKLNQLDKDKEYKIYCNSGNRSSKALEMMRGMGFSDVTELSGGIQAWMASNLSTCVNC